MKPASAMSFALRKPGRSALVCACAGTFVGGVTVITANAAERRRSRFVSIQHSLCFERAGAASRSIWLRDFTRLRDGWLCKIRQTRSLPGCPLLAVRPEGADH